MISRDKTPGCRWYLVMAIFFMTGCASVFNPYDSEFQCPDTDKGSCVSIPDAYEMSISDDPKGDPGSNLAKPEEDQSPARASAPASDRKEPDIRYDYLNKKYAEMSALIADPATPLVAPPEVIRVLILSYTGKENNLFGYRYVYLFATEPEWIISSGKEIE